jgi:hypothetical protein
MIEVVLHKRSPYEIINIVRSMKEHGMIEGKDFAFRYNQSKWDPYDYEAVSAEHTIFMFYEEKYATWFQLRWA